MANLITQPLMKAGLTSFHHSSDIALRYQISPLRYVMSTEQTIPQGLVTEKEFYHAKNVLRSKIQRLKMVNFTL